MAFQPRNYLPIYKGEDANPDALQQPAQVIRNIAVSPDWDPLQDASAAAEAVENYYSGYLAQFVAQSRLMHDRSGLGSNRFNQQAPGISIRYENVLGLEKIYVTVAPESFGGGNGIETNLDGYVSIMSCYSQPSTHGASNDVSYDFYMNDKKVGSYTFTMGKKSEIVVITFGPTALKCWSIADGENPTPPPPNKNNPNSHVGKIVPPRPKIAKSHNTGYYNPYSYGLIGSNLDAYDDLFLYPLYDWNSDENNGAYQTDNLDYPFQQPLMAQIILNDIPITVIKFDVTKDNPSPIKDRDVNKFRAKLTSPVTAYTGLGTLMVQSEFYSRYFYRKVTKSWTKSVPPGGSITVNDTPLHFGIRTNTLDVAPLDIDLTPYPVDRTTPTPFTAFSTYTPNTDISQPNKPSNVAYPNQRSPYQLGYWRLGDALSTYTYFSQGSWSILAPYVQQYYNFLQQLKDFFDNKSVQTLKVVVFFNPGYGVAQIADPTGGPGGGPSYYWDYDVTPDMWPQPFVSPTNDPFFFKPGEYPPSADYLTDNAALYALLSSQLATWTANNNLVQKNLINQSIYYADDAAISMAKQLIADANAFQTLFVGVDIPSVNKDSFTYPIYGNGTPGADFNDASDWWKNVFVGLDQNTIYMNALDVQLFQRSNQTLTFGETIVNFLVRQFTNDTVSVIKASIDGIVAHSKRDYP